MSGSGSNKEPGGFDYWVSDEQLAAFAKLSDLEKLQWVDEARRFTLLARTPETAERQERLRAGKRIVPEEGSGEASQSEARPNCGR